MFEERFVNTFEAVNKFMAERGWQQNICESCERIFFTKPSVERNDSICGWHSCDTGMYPFRNYSKRNKMLTPSQIYTKMSEYFRSFGFEREAPLNIVNTQGKTDLVIAGVQMFDGIIHRNQKIRNDKVFVAQPCVRMQYQSNVESQEGTSTSFVNVCTEKMGAELTEHLQAIDHWCTLLSKLGLHMNDFVLIMRKSTEDWGTGKFSSLELFFSYEGLELGDAAYLLVPQENRPALPISDIGFGLERITWAVNKTNSYFDLLMPWTMSGSREMFDACRTMSLLLLCGVRPSNKGSGLQCRRFAKVLSEKYYREDVYSIIGYYLEYWSQFITPSVSTKVLNQRSRLEIERFINLKVCEMLQLPPPQNETTEEYFERLAYTGITSIYQLREAIQLCKT